VDDTDPPSISRATPWQQAVLWADGDIRSSPARSRQCAAEARVPRRLVAVGGWMAAGIAGGPAMPWDASRSRPAAFLGPDESKRFIYHKPVILALVRGTVAAAMRRIIQR